MEIFNETMDSVIYQYGGSSRTKYEFTYRDESSYTDGHSIDENVAYWSSTNSDLPDITQRYASVIKVYRKCSV
jgi:hypothetical protein